MASTQTSLKTAFKDLTSLKSSTQRPYRERLEDAPIKKRVMAEINLKRRFVESSPRTPKVKKERVEECPGDSSLGGDGSVKRQLLATCGAKALDLSPGLKHTLAQFTLSSQSSLGGPAAFSARSGQESSTGIMAPLPSPPVLGGGPLLVPCDSSTELTHSLLEGESISCFVVGGEKRLCLPQVLNSVLRDFSLQQINAVCDELYVYCSRCDAEQLHILKVLGILPFNAPSCGLITLTDAQRLCNALLRPGHALPQDSTLKLPAQGLLKESEASFQVEHQCLGKAQGLFIPQFYTQPEAPCIQCLECQLLFSPEKFVMHSHKSPDKRTCHWGFDSAKWPCYLQLGRKYLGTAEEAPLKQLLEEMKEKFHYQLKVTLDKNTADEDGLGRGTTFNLCSPMDKLPHGDLGRKGKTPPTLIFNRLYPEIKEEPNHMAIIHPSYYLYTCDKVVAPNVSLPHPLRKEGNVSAELLGALLKHHRSGARPVSDTETHTASSCTPAEAARTQRASECEDELEPPAVAMETLRVEKARTPTLAKDAGVEDDKDKIVVEIVQMYTRQQEKLNATLHKQRQLEMELEALRGGEAARLRELSVERSELQSELEAAHTEHARRMGEVQEEQQRLERRLERLRQQPCACEPNAHGEQEARYAAQLTELRVRLDQAEADREELQEALRREREARENLEGVIAQLRQQMAESASPNNPIAQPELTNPPPVTTDPPATAEDGGQN
ncbi:ski-like protein [Scleropages formosus]|uniref:SKI like proto-onco n=1 Tax=Scleropages formosus TaxID=113540 RepID=A0A8C9RJ25_SCLFO|nr:ski-like protein [Scleropages formosus]